MSSPTIQTERTVAVDKHGAPISVGDTLYSNDGYGNSAATVEDIKDNGVWLRVGRKSIRLDKAVLQSPGCGWERKRRKGRKPKAAHTSPRQNKVRQRFLNERADETGFKIGDRVMTPKTGMVTRYSKEHSDIVFVKWDGRKLDEEVLISLLRPDDSQQEHPR